MRDAYDRAAAAGKTSLQTVRRLWNVVCRQDVAERYGNDTCASMKKLALAMLVSWIAVPAHAEDLVVRDDRLFLPVSVEGNEALALLDSGAEVTTFNRPFAEAVGIGAGEEVSARGTGAAVTTAELVENKTLTAIGRQIDLPVSAVMDLADIESRVVKAPVPVILGRELFDAGRVYLDIEGGSIAWHPQEEPVGGVVLPLTTQHGIETIPVQLADGRTIAADFDLGNGTGLLISSELACELGLEPVGVEPGGGIGGSLGRLVVYVPELTIAGVTFRGVRAHVSEDMQVPANVGVALLRQFLILTDFPQRQVWLQARR